MRPILKRLTGMHICLVRGHAPNPIVQGSPDASTNNLNVRQRSLWQWIVAGSSEVFINGLQAGHKHQQCYRQ